MKWLRKATCVAAACCISLHCSALPPDILVFLTDDHSRADSSVYGSKDFPTPNMQRLAQRGLTFDNAFVVSPTCAPSRAALLTGLMPARNGAQLNHAKPRADLKKWPAYFHDLGYEVVAFGKVAHYQQTSNYGFDYFAHDSFHDHVSIPATVKYLRQRDPGSTRPLCLMVGSNWPHVPWPETTAGYDPAKLTLPAGSIETTMTREWWARYAVAVQKADDDFGVVYDAAQKALGQDLITLFSGDHGTQWPFGKWNLYDAGIRVPLIVEWREHIKAGARASAMVTWIDILPTLVEAAGGKAPTDIDGKSFMPVLRNPESPLRDKIYTTHSGDGTWNIYPMRSVRTSHWKYILNLHPEYAFTTHIDLPGDLGGRNYWSTWESAAENDPQAAATVKRYHQRPAEELYDLSTDPNEQRNLATNSAHEKKLIEMRTDLQSWMSANDQQTTFAGKPRLLRDPTSYGPGAAAAVKK